MNILTTYKTYLIDWLTSFGATDNVKQINIANNKTVDLNN